MSEKIKYEIKRSKIKEHIKFKLWSLSSGRCEICNTLLFKDNAYGFEGNFSNIAHIIGVGENGPRSSNELGDKINNFENLMLLCPICHKSIDSNEMFFKKDYLLRIKRNHEKKVEYLTNLISSKECQIISYLINVNDSVKQYSSIKEMCLAITDFNYFPKQNSVIDLCDDNGGKYLASKEEILKRSDELVKAYNVGVRYNEKDVLAVFAFACQPLLIKLGSLIGDQREVVIFQPHRDNDENRWSFSKYESTIKFNLSCNNVENTDIIALIIDISAPIDDSRIDKCFNKKVKIYHLSVDNPNRSVANSYESQDLFVKSFRNCLELIRKENKTISTLHIFPAMPVSFAIRAGMDRMPKVDVKWLIYEISDFASGFYPTITIDK